MNNDLISRSALLERLKHNLNACNPDTLSERCYQDAIYTVTYFPAVDAGPKWICIKDRLPKDPDEIVLCSVTGKHNHVNYVGAHAMGTYDDVSGWILEDDPNWENPPVTHWMPLPEPPKEVRR